MGAEIVMPKTEKKPEFLDKSGHIILAGDLIVYGVAYGRSAGLSYGKVLEVAAPKENWRGKGKVKLRVQGVDKPWGAVQTKKPGTLEFSERVLKITRDYVPADILAHLDKIEVGE